MVLSDAWAPPAFLFYFLHSLVFMMSSQVSVECQLDCSNSKLETTARTRKVKVNKWNIPRNSTNNWKAG
jgi:hypothetical protein